MADSVVDTSQDEFNSGFNETTPAATPEVEVKQPEPTVEVVDTKPKAPEPKYVQITQEQFDSFQASATKTAAIESQLSKVFGTMGDMQQVVKKLQSATPAGMRVEVPAEALAEMQKDFPELATHLEKVLKSVRGTGSESEAKTVEKPDPQEIQKLVREATIVAQVEALEDSYPKWREIVGTVDSEGKHDPNNDYRKWLATQDAEYQRKINSTNSATIIATSIKKFLEAKKTPLANPPAPKVTARRDRINSAIAPKGDGGQPAPTKTADDDFAQGFRQG